ncbi:unnamed protein product [Coregonus sp. 'balchen']|nr:unnamed protein product [Coregonus sp. 'balchen']
MTSMSPTHSDSSASSSKHDSHQDSWEIIEGLKGNPGNIQEPEKQEGFLLKRRKWPMKGWQKRYFLLEKGILKYSKRGADLKKGKLHGCIDVGLSVMSIKKKTKAIDLDTNNNIYHLKVKSEKSQEVKSQQLFDDWVSKLRHHRVFRQNEIAMYPHERLLFHPSSHLSPNLNDSMRQCRSSLAKQASVVQQAKVSAWLHSSEDMDRCCRDLEECESYLLELNLLLKSMEVLHRTYSAPSISLMASTYDIPKKEKKGPRKWRSKNYNKDAKKDIIATLQVPGCVSPPASPHLHTSHPNLSTAEANIQEAFAFLESPDSPTDANRLQEDFCRLANNIHSTLRSAYSSLSAERDRVRHTIDLKAPPPAQVMGLKTGYGSVSKVSNESRASIPESMSEFFDAQEYQLTSSSSENEASDDDSYISDVSDSVSMDNGYSNEGGRERHDSAGSGGSGVQVARRRTTLPSPQPSSSSVSLWNILKNNIGKDLSKVAMPVQLNEPLNTLQRLCEEVYVATFAVSAYASSYHRAGSKPFNPILGETYECDRPDKGFRFGDHYEWNKVTSCIHNILSGQRWIEHYGEMSIKNTSSDACQCKVTFIKARSWSSTVNEIEGVLTDTGGRVIHSFFGKWHEGVYQGYPPSAICIWRATEEPRVQQRGLPCAVVTSDLTYNPVTPREHRSRAETELT